MPDSIPAASPVVSNPEVKLTSEPAPKVDGAIGNSAIGIGYALAKLATALTGDGGIRLLALAAVASFTWVASYAISTYMKMETERNALMSRVGEDRIEREKADNARREKEMRDWTATEMEKQRVSFSTNLSFVTKSFAEESEKNRAMVFKLAGARIPPGQLPPDELPTAIPLIPPGK